MNGRRLVAAVVQIVRWAEAFGSVRDHFCDSVASYQSALEFILVDIVNCFIGYILACT